MNVMKKCIGTKLVNAMPMSRLDYNHMRGWALPNNENGADEGYLVEYTDGGKPNHSNFAGYISWSPKEQFDGAYRETTGLTFGMALEALKIGAKAARAGWNGKGMWIILVPGTPDLRPNPNTPYGRALPDARTIEILPHIDMWTVNAEGRRAMLPGWLASQSDMLASDWMLVE